MHDAHLDRLDAVANEVASGHEDKLGVLSKGEYLYVILAANRPDLLGDDSVAYALSRMGPDWVKVLVARWQYKSYPRRVNAGARP